MEQLQNLILKVLHEVNESRIETQRQFVEMRAYVDARFASFQEAVDKRFDEVDKRFESVDKRFDEVDKRFEKRFDQIDQRFDHVDICMDTLAKRTLKIS